MRHGTDGAELTGHMGPSAFNQPTTQRIRIVPENRQHSRVPCSERILPNHSGGSPTIRQVGLSSVFNGLRFNYDNFANFTQ